MNCADEPNGSDGEADAWHLKLDDLAQSIAVAREELSMREANARSLASAAEIDEPRHPNFDRYVFGGDAMAAGLKAEDAASLSELLAADASEAGSIILKAASGRDDIYVLRLFPSILGGSHDVSLSEEEGADPDEDKLVLGHVFYDAGLRSEHAAPLMGLWSLGATRFLQRLEDARTTYGSMSLGLALTTIVAADDGVLARRGTTARHNRAANRYFARRAAWLAAGEQVHAGTWRSRPAKLRQGQLIITTARQLCINIPEGLARGAAADWLEDEGANLRFRDKEAE